MHNFHTTVF